jgi:multicomponent Na+:H+ antiporter subunit B
LFFGLLIYGTSDLPYRGDADSAMHQQRSTTNTPVAGSYFIQEAYNDAATPNMVTVVLGDYRSIDTFGEQVVIYTAGLIVLLLLRRERRKR